MENGLIYDNGELGVLVFITGENEACVEYNEDTICHYDYSKFGGMLGLVDDLIKKGVSDEDVEKIVFKIL